MRVPYVLHSLKRINGNFSLSYLKSHLTELMTWITLYLPQYLSCWTHRLITITTLNLAKTSPRIYLAISSFYGLLYRNKILVSLLHLDPDPDIMIPYDLYADSVKLTSYHTGHFTVYNTHFFYSRKYYEEKMKVFVDDINVTIQWRCYIDALLAIFFKNCYFYNANPKSGLCQNFSLRIANLFHR